MKIIHVVNYYQEGMGYQENWLPYFQKINGHEVKIIASDRHFPFDNYQEMEISLGKRISAPRTIVERGVEIHKIKTVFENVGHRFVLFGKKDLFDILKKEDPDAVHVHCQNNINVLYILWYRKAFGKNFRIFIDCHSNDLNSPFLPKIKKRLNFIYRVALWFYGRLIVANIDGFLPIDEGSKEYLERYLAIPSQKIKITPLGTDSILFKRNDKARTQLRDEYGIGEREILAIATGSFSYKKNSDILLKTLRRLFGTASDFKMMMIGAIDPGLKKDFEDVIANKKLFFLPFTKNAELYRYYSMADLSVWTSATISTRDAMSCSLPVIIRNVRGMNYLVPKRGENGFTFEDENDLCDILENIARDPAVIKKMGERSRDAVEKTYSWDKIAKDSIEIYKNKQK